MERLSTGLRINSAADDAAGMQISTRLESQTRGMSVAMRNAQDGISMVQTAEGAMDEMTNITHRMKDLALQATNGTNSAADNTALNAEFGELAAELKNIVDTTNFGGKTLLASGGAFNNVNASGAAITVDIQIGTNAGDKLSIDAQAELVKVASLLATGGALSASNAATFLASAGKASGMLTTLSGANGDGGMLAELGAARSKLGASINRLEHTITNLGNMVENTSAAKGRITDADFAVESSNMTKNQMLMQAGTTMLSQTNQLPGMAMSLLR
jgi:flagellin